MATSLKGLDLRKLGFVVREIVGARSAPGRDIGKAMLPGALGGFLLDGVVRPRPRSLQIVGTFVRESAALREEAEQILKGIGFSGLIRLVQTPSNGVPRWMDVVLDGESPIQPYAPALLSQASQWSIPVFSPGGVWYRLDPIALHIAAPNVPYSLMGLENGPSTPVLRVIGDYGGIDPEIVYRDAWGREQARFTSQGFDLEEDDWAEIDCRHGRVTISRSGVSENGIALFTEASDFPFVFDPNHGDGTNPPTLEITEGSMAAYYWPTLV